MGIPTISMRGMASIVSLCVFALMFVAARPAAARAAHSITLVKADGCPSGRAFTAALQTIFPDANFVTDGREESLRVELSDVGADYRVRVGTVQRDFTDAAMRCDERARKAAVLVALALEPPTVEVPPVAGARKSEVDSNRHVRLPSVQLEIGGVFDAAPRSVSNSLFSGGAQVRLFVGARYVGAVVGIAGLSPTTLQVTGARARLARVPIDLAVRGQLRRGRLALSLDAGVVIAIQITNGLDVAPSLEETRMEVGVRIAAKVEYWAWKRVAPFIAIQGEYVPVPSDLVLPAAGIVGTTPQFWVGGALGLALRLR